MIDVAAESWRLGKAFARLLGKLDPLESGRHAGQLRFHARRLEENLGRCGLRIVDVEGTPFDEGIAAVALNLDDFDTTDALVVDQMIEPIVMGAEGIRRRGTVMLRKADA